MKIETYQKSLLIFTGIALIPIALSYGIAPGHYNFEFVLVRFKRRYPETSVRQVFFNPDTSEPTINRKLYYILGSILICCLAIISNE